jgi:hypothetical protein
VIPAVIDTGDLIEVVWTAALAGLTVTAAWAFAILGSARALDYGREGRVVEAVAYGVLGVLAISFVTAALVFGIVTMTDK